MTLVAMTKTQLALVHPAEHPLAPAAVHTIIMMMMMMMMMMMLMMMLMTIPHSDDDDAPVLAVLRPVAHCVLTPPEQ